MVLEFLFQLQHLALPPKLILLHFSLPPFSMSDNNNEGTDLPTVVMATQTGVAEQRAVVAATAPKNKEKRNLCSQTGKERWTVPGGSPDSTLAVCTQLVDDKVVCDNSKGKGARKVAFMDKMFRPGMPLEFCAPITAGKKGGDPTDAKKVRSPSHSLN